MRLRNITITILFGLCAAACSEGNIRTSDNIIEKTTTVFEIDNESGIENSEGTLLKNNQEETPTQNTTKTPTKNSDSLSTVKKADAVQADPVRNTKVVPSVAGRGPTGLNWPSHTPAYNTPADIKISNLSELDAALASAKSGDVIEVAPHSYSQNITIKNGNRNWEKNVLVRPPLGKTQSVILNKELTINAPHVTVAGFRANSSLKIRDDGDRSALARMTLSTQSFIGIRNNSENGFVEDAGIYEIVAPTVRSGGDRMNISSIKNGGVKRFTISGVWLTGSNRKIGSGDHSDTLQTFETGGGWGISDLTIENSVFLTSSSAPMQLADLKGLLVMNNVLSTSCTYAQSVQPGHECNGSHNINLSKPNPGMSFSAYNSSFYGTITLCGVTMDIENSFATKIPEGGKYGGTLNADSKTKISEDFSSTYKTQVAPSVSNIWN